MTLVVLFAPPSVAPPSSMPQSSLRREESPQRAGDFSALRSI